MRESISYDEAEANYGCGPTATAAHKKRAIANGNAEVGDGYKYRGRGLVKLTWKKGYGKFKDIAGADVVANPDLALDLPVAVRIMMIGTKDGMFTGTSLSTHLGGAKPDYYHAHYIIHGDNPAGSGHPDKAEQFQFYAEKFEKFISQMIAKFIFGACLALTLTTTAMAGSYQIPGLEVCDVNSSSRHCPLQLDENGYLVDSASGTRLSSDPDFKGVVNDATLYESTTSLALEYSNASSSKSWVVLIFSYKNGTLRAKNYISLSKVTLANGERWVGQSCRGDAALTREKTVLASAFKVLCNGSVNSNSSPTTWAMKGFVESTDVATAFVSTLGVAATAGVCINVVATRSARMAQNPP